MQQKGSNEHTTAVQFGSSQSTPPLAKQQLLPPRGGGPKQPLSISSPHDSFSCSAFGGQRIGQASLSPRRGAVTHSPSKVAAKNGIVIPVAPAVYATTRVSLRHHTQTPRARLERATCRLEGGCSIQLSYRDWCVARLGGRSARC